MGMVDPAGHTMPAAQGVHTDELLAPTVAEKVPTGHKTQVVTSGAPAAIL